MGDIKDEAKKKLKELIKKLYLKSIVRFESDSSYEQLVEEANGRVVKNSKNPKLQIGEVDIIIIAGYLKEGINFAHSGDQGFLKTCEELNINVIPTPKKDIEKENKKS